MVEAIEWTPKARVVLDAAAQLFYARGIHAVGVDAIAAAAGVTKKTLYDRFGSKDRLVAEYLAARDHAWRTHLDERLAAAGADPRERILAVFAASADWAVDRGGRGCAMVIHATARNDWAAMAIAAGLASGFDEPAIRVGHRLELEARRRNDLVDDTAVREPPPRKLFSKFKTILIGRSVTARVERPRP